MERRGADHMKAQRDGKKRDNGVCQICGCTRHTEGHHAFDYRFGGAADDNNIVTLCHECHMKVHHGGMDVYVV